MRNYFTKFANLNWHAIQNDIMFEVHVCCLIYHFRYTGQENVKYHMSLTIIHGSNILCA